MRRLTLTMITLGVLPLFPLLAAEPGLVRIAVPVGGHIHPAACVANSGAIVVTYGRVNHRDLRITRSMDRGKTWSDPLPFGHTVGKTYYPGSLTTLSDGRLVHAWNRWSSEDNEKEPRSVLYYLSKDDGVTWSEPQPLPRDPEKPSIIRHPFTELSPNRWLFSLSDKTLGISRDDGMSWSEHFEYYTSGRAINGRACPRTVQLDAETIGVVFYDIDAKQEGGPGLFFLKIPLAGMKD